MHKIVEMLLGKIVKEKVKKEHITETLLNAHFSSTLYLRMDGSHGEEIRADNTLNVSYDYNFVFDSHGITGVEIVFLKGEQITYSDIEGNDYKIDISANELNAAEINWSAGESYGLEDATVIIDMENGEVESIIIEATFLDLGEGVEL